MSCASGLWHHNDENSHFFSWDWRRFLRMEQMDNEVTFWAELGQWVRGERLLREIREERELAYVLNKEEVLIYSFFLLAMGSHLERGFLEFHVRFEL